MIEKKHPRTINVDINGCARCGFYHKEVEFIEFSELPIIDSDGTAWNFWAQCPRTLEPILLKVIDELYRVSSVSVTSKDYVG